MKPLIKKVNGCWRVKGRYGFWGQALAWCHQQNIKEGNYGVKSKQVG